METSMTLSSLDNTSMGLIFSPWIISLTLNGAILLQGPSVMVEFERDIGLVLLYLSRLEEAS